MSTTYVKFAPNLERIEADFDQKVRRITHDIQQYITNSPQINGIGHHTRDAHAKGYAAARAEFEILGNLPAELAQGLYAKPGRYEAIVRFSNGSARVTTDKSSGLAMGLAIKILGVGGKTMLDDEADCGNFDYNLINWPVFFCNSAEHYQ